MNNAVTTPVSTKAYGIQTDALRSKRQRERLRERQRERERECKKTL